ncbi:MAG: glycoside hydrolase family 32 protein [Pseudomonadota bacterium]
MNKDTVRKERKKRASVPELFGEKYRPQVHFSAAKYWINDPNGLVWHRGTYHLFYQHNPTGNHWGNMHWGHAISQDLVHWEHRPIALHADPLGLGYMFSGCAVSDEENSSGMGSAGQPPLVALYTSCTVEGVQSQSLAYSLDDGDTWQQYDANPVIQNPGVRDFRDPKVFWHEPSSRWILSLAAYDRISFYASRNLIEWTHLSDFSKPDGSHSGVWECPDLFPLNTESGDKKWLLVISVSPEHSTRDESVQYFVGEFDGSTFIPDDNGERWLDYGADNYGAVTWEGIPPKDGRRIAIGWMSSWRYAKEMPTYPWRGNMTIPRELRLVKGTSGFELASLPVREIEGIRTGIIEIPQASVGAAATRDIFCDLPPDLLDLDLHFKLPQGELEPFGIRFANGNDENVEIAIDMASGKLVVDRTHVGQAVPNPKLVERLEAPLRKGSESLSLRLIKDVASVEVFADEGRSVVSANLFYDAPFDRVETFGPDEVTLGGEVSVLASIWRERCSDV